MPRTPLHAVLGEPGDALDFKLIEGACRAQVAETASIEWKRDYPLDATEPGGKQAQQLELAKDIAAMANSGGGLIVYGVDESRGADESTASSIMTVGHVTDARLQRIRQVAGGLIYPPVMSLDLHGLVSPDDPSQVVLAAIVPDSAERPHLVNPRGPDFWFMAPWRDGPHTRPMVERQLASAYRDREMSRRRREEDFEDLSVSFIERCGVTTVDPWVCVTASPSEPLARRNHVTAEEVDQLLDGCERGRLSRGGYSPLSGAWRVELRRGLRSYARVSRRDLRLRDIGQALRLRARVEIHEDGSVCVGFTRGGAFEHEGLLHGQVAVDDLETAILDAFVLVHRTCSLLGIVSDYRVRLDVRPTTQIFRRPDFHLAGYYQPFEETERVFSWSPIDGVFALIDDREAALQSCVDVIQDALNQAGSWSRLTVEALLAQSTARAQRGVPPPS